MTTDKPKTMVEWPSEKKKPTRDRLFALLHQLARHVVNRRDVVGVHRMTQAERVGQERRAQQNRMIMKGDQRPNPSPGVDADEQRIHGDNPALQARRDSRNVHDEIFNLINRRAQP